MSYIVGDNNRLYHCSSDGNTMHLIGTIILETLDDGSYIAVLTPDIGNVKLVFEETAFLKMLNKPVPLDIVFNSAKNYKLIDSFTKTVFTRGLLSMPCPYVDHRNTFPSMQELIDALNRKSSFEFFAIVPIDDEQYNVYIYNTL